MKLYQFYMDWPLFHQNLIDLAGSEKAASDQDRRKEGSYINKSLLTLGTVISKLTDPNTGKSPSHIPYRDSKLTRILQTALSGLAKVAVICTISPSNLEESLNTLKFASRVKRITTHAKNDEVMDDKALLQKYRTEIVELKSKLQSTAELLQKEKESALIAERRDHDQQMKLMRNTRNAMKERIDHLTRLILTSSSVVNNDPASATATLQQQLQDVQNGMPSPAADNEHKNSNASGLVAAGGSSANASQQQEIVQLQKLLSKAVRESNEKDQRILALEEQLGQQTAINAQLETELSVTKAELELTRQLQTKEGSDEKKSLRPSVSQRKQQLVWHWEDWSYELQYKTLYFTSLAWRKQTRDVFWDSMLAICNWWRN